MAQTRLDTIEKAMYGYRCATECIAELTLYLLSLTQTGKFYQKAAVLEQGFWTLQLVVCISSSSFLFLMVLRSFTTWEFGRYYRKFDRLEIRYSYFLGNFTSESPSQNSEHTRDSFQDKCPMIVPFSQPQRIDRKRFRALFRTLTPLQNRFPYFYFRKTLPGSYSLRSSSRLHTCSTFLACLSLRARAARKPITL